MSENTSPLLDVPPRAWPPSRIFLAILTAILSGFALWNYLAPDQWLNADQGDLIEQGRWLSLRVYSALFAIGLAGTLFFGQPAYLRALALCSVLLVFGVWRLDYAYDDYGSVVYHSLIGRNRDPGFLATDWYTNVSESINGYYLFAKFFGLLPQSWCPAAFFFFWTIGVVMLGWVHFLMANRVFSSRLEILCTSFGAFALSFVMTRGKQWGTFTLGDNDFLYPFLTPQTLALAFGFLGILSLLRGRYYWAGACLGLAINLHVNTGQHFLLITASLAAFSSLVSVRKYVRTVILALVIGLPHLIPILLDQFSPEVGEGTNLDLTYIMVSGAFRHPHHLLPSTWPLFHYLEFGGLLAVAAVGFFVKPDLNANDRSFAIIIATSLALCFVGWFFVEVVPIDFVAKTQLFRVTIIIKVVALPYAVYATFRLLRKFAGAVGGFDVAAFLRRNSEPACWSVLTLAFVLGIPVFYSQTGFFAGPDSEVERWAREETPVDSVFLLPVIFGYLQEFPIRAERGIVADMKRLPFQGRDYAQWYQRICHISGESPIADVHQIRMFRRSGLFSRYHKLQENDLLRLAAMYGVTHVLRSVRFPIDGIEPIYDDEKYLVYSVNDLRGTPERDAGDFKPIRR